jgi:hypothetical protein
MKTKNIFGGFGVLAAALLTACCAGSPGLEGKWVEPIPGMEDQMQGISLEKDGKASSINSATLQYKSWVRQGDTLVLSGQSLGNGQTIDFVDSYQIEKLSNDELVLKNGDMTINYTKQAE